MNLSTRLFGKRKLPEPSPVVMNRGKWESLEIIVTEIESCDSIPALAAYAGHYSGYVREAAISRCLEVASGELLPALADRLNDWVPEVRRAARSAILTLFAQLPAHLYLDILPDIFALHSATRTDHSEWLSQFEKIFVASIPLETLVDGVVSRHPKIARICFDIILHHDLIDQVELTELAIGTRDLTISMRAVELCGRLPLPAKLQQFSLAAKSPCGPVRTISLRALLSVEGGIDKDALAIGFLCDAQASVRDIAMNWLKLEGFDLRSYFHRLLSEAAVKPKVARICLLSLSKLGNPADVELMKRFAASPSPLMRYTALLSWLKLDVASKDEVSERALSDESLRVRKLALVLVKKHGAFLPFAQVRQLIEMGADTGLALSLSASAKWNWIECIAILASNGAIQEKYNDRLCRELRSWLSSEGRSYDLPSRDQVDFLSEPHVLKALCALEYGRPEIESLLHMHFSHLPA